MSLGLDASTQFSQMSAVADLFCRPFEQTWPNIKINIGTLREERRTFSTKIWVFGKHSQQDLCNSLVKIINSAIEMEEEHKTASITPRKYGFIICPATTDEIPVLSGEIHNVAVDQFAAIQGVFGAAGLF